MKIAIVGLGLMGGSFAKDLRKAEFITELVGCEANPLHAQRALELQLVDRVVALSEALTLADVILLAVPVDAILELLPQILDKVSALQTVIDLGSTKLALAEAVRDHPRRERYVAAHPMAGTENAGPDAACNGLFAQKNVLLCDLEWSAPDACRIALEVFHAVGLKFEFMSAQQHDRHAAYVSHLSHVAAYALSLAVQSEEKAGYAVPRLAGGGFDSTVRLAKSSSSMWLPIFQQNRQEVLAAIAAYAARLAELQSCLEREDWQALEHLIVAANQIKELL